MKYDKTTHISLAGQWSVSGIDESGIPINIPASVPGDVYGAMLAAELIPDPFFARNECNIQWVAKNDWSFSRDFEIDESLLSHRSVILRLEDCDTFAQVFVNGQLVGETSNRFRRWDFDVRAALCPGRNSIKLVFASAWRKGDEARTAINRPYPMSLEELTWFHNGALIRKPACHHGWDWGLALMTTGPCGTIELIASDGDRIDYVFCDQDWSRGLSHCNLRIHAILENGEDVVNTIEIDNPPLWWPAGQGEQRFFEYSVIVKGRPLHGRIGLRKLELDTTSGAVCFKVNDRPIFMKGANWIPCDAFDARQTPARYRDLLESAVSANMNMIRLWGGGQFEKDCFYDICDELGLLVWHDQMFSCALYPANSDFLDNVRAELEHQLLRLRDHACIALWCGDNECIGAVRGWYPETISSEARPSYIEEAKLRYAMQEEIAHRCDPARTFWPSSPCAGKADFDYDGWSQFDKGDMHLWTIWSDRLPLDSFYNYRPRFCSEFGYQSFPAKEIAESFCSPGEAHSGSPDFEWHQKCTGGNDRIRKGLSMLFPPPKSHDSLFYLSQVQQAIAIKTAVEAWRPLRPHCMGTLFWQLNDLWPVSSWSSIDYSCKWKQLHYHARRFFAPAAVVARPSNDRTSLEFWALNDNPFAIACTAIVRLFTFKGSLVSSESFHAILSPESATLLASRSVDYFGPEEDRLSRFISLELHKSCANDNDAAIHQSPLHRNEWFFAPFKNAHLEDATISATVNGFDLTLSSDKPAFFVWANAYRISGEFSDNSFTLLPGEPRTLKFSPKCCTSPDIFRQSLSIVHLASQIQQ